MAAEPRRIGPHPPAPISYVPLLRRLLLLQRAQLDIGQQTSTVSDLVLLPSRTENPIWGEAAFQPFGSLLLDRDPEVAMYLEGRGLVPREDGLPPLSHGSSSRKGR